MVALLMSRRRPGFRGSCRSGRRCSSCSARDRPRPSRSGWPSGSAGPSSPSLRDRAARLEIERDQRSRLAAATERARVAREMHDIVGHNLSVIITLADGGAYAADVAPERSKEALRLIGDTGRQALGELRRMLGVLREKADAPELGAPARHRRPRRAVRTDPRGRPGGRLPNRRRAGHARPGRAADGLPHRPGSAHQHPQARRAPHPDRRPGRRRPPGAAHPRPGHGRDGPAQPVAPPDEGTRTGRACGSAPPCTAARSTRAPLPAAGGSSWPFSTSRRCPAGDTDDHRPHRRRPAAAALRLPHAAGRHARHRSGRRGRRTAPRPCAGPPNCGPTSS